jgi:hypothetical protein
MRRALPPITRFATRRYSDVQWPGRRPGTQALTESPLSAPD